MAKKNFLKQIRALDRKKEKYPYALSNWWEAWECVGNPDELGDWIQVAEGTLDECIQELTNEISWEVDQEIDADRTRRRWNVEYDDDTENYIAAWEARQQQRRAEIKETCLVEGWCLREGKWEIRSVLTAEKAAHNAGRKIFS